MKRSKMTETLSTSDKKVPKTKLALQEKYDKENQEFTRKKTRRKQY